MSRIVKIRSAEVKVTDQEQHVSLEAGEPLPDNLAEGEEARLDALGALAAEGETVLELPGRPPLDANALEPVRPAIIAPPEEAPLTPEAQAQAPEPEPAEPAAEPRGRRSRQQ